MNRALLVLVGAAAASACRGETPRAIDESRLHTLVDSLRPAIERAAGLGFRDSVRVRMTTRDEVRAYLAAQVDQDFPPGRLEGLQAAYGLLRMLPDSLDLRALLLDLYAEQVAGYYDPEVRTLYAVRGTDPMQVRLIFAHELVHALQHQYLPLDSLMSVGDDADRLAATQAVLEGHAHVVSIRTITSGRDPTTEPGFWDLSRQQIRTAQEQMESVRRAPLVLRERLVFPYLGGAEFIVAWSATRGRSLPGVDSFPTSTEQVLHPSRYPADLPHTVRFTAADEVLFEDTLGELDTAILLAELRGARTADAEAPLGWGGDRLRAYGSDAGPALVWYSVWDAAPPADRMAGMLERQFAPREGYRVSVERLALGGHPAVRLVHAPAGWSGWTELPAATVLGRP